MLMPSIFGENLFDDFYGIFHFIMMTEMKKLRRNFTGKKPGYMKTDIKETDKGYELEMIFRDLKKMKLKLTEDGYLNQCSKGLGQREEERRRHYIRRERYAGACREAFM